MTANPVGWFEIYVQNLDRGNMTLIKRLTLIAIDGVIAKVFYPVFPPDRNADAVIAWLSAQRR